MSRGVTSLPNSVTTTARAVQQRLDQFESLVGSSSGAAEIGIADSGSFWTGTTVQAVCDEIPTYGLRNVIADPGTGQAIPVTASGQCKFTVAAGVAETNTLAIPTYVGQQIALNVATLGAGGTRAVTAAQAINQAGNTVMTFNNARDFILLLGISTGGVLRWQVVSNDGVTLS